MHAIAKPVLKNETAIFHLLRCPITVGIYHFGIR
jgi:hypothetical protein